jgi:hypothetical protein
VDVGHRYCSADGTVRELRLLRLGNSLARPRGEAEVAVAAYTAAHGRPALWPDEWAKKFTVRPRETVSRVVVADIDLAAGVRSIISMGPRTRQRCCASGTAGLPRLVSVAACWRV